MKTFRLFILRLNSFPGPFRLGNRPLLRARGTELRRRAAKLTIPVSGKRKPSSLRTGE